MVIEPSSRGPRIRESNKMDGLTEAPKQKRALFDAVLKKIAASDDESVSSLDSEYSAAVDVSVPGVQAGSPAAALGMVVAPSSVASPICESTEKAVAPKAPKQKKG